MELESRLFVIWSNNVNASTVIYIATRHCSCLYRRPRFVCSEHNMKPLVYLMNMLGLAPFILEEGRGFRKFRASTFMFVYSAAMFVIVLLGELVLVIGNGDREAMENVYTFATTVKSSANMITHSGFLFFTLLFRRKIVKFLHVLLKFNSSIHNTFISYGRNFNYVMAQVFVVVTVHAVCTILLALSLQSIDIVTVCRFFSITVSILSVNLVSLLFINLAVVLKRCFTRINTCLCELIQCSGQESFGLYRQISSVKHAQRLIEVNYKYDRPQIRIEHVRRAFDFLSDFVDLLNSVYSAHTLILVTFYFVMFIYESYFGFVGVMHANRGITGRAERTRVTFIETAFNAFGFTVLIYFCSSTTCEVRRCVNVLLLITFAFRNDVKEIMNFQECKVNV